MPGLPDLISGFKTLREVDLNAIRSQAEDVFHIAVIGSAGVGKTTLINQLLSGPGVSDPLQLTPISEQRLDREFIIYPYSTGILMLDAAQPDHSLEAHALEKLRSSGVPLIVCYNKADLLLNTRALSAESFHQPGVETVAISALDRQSILKQLVPALLRVYKGKEVLLARRLPLLRETVSQKLIQDTCFVNAAYSLATGVAAINPVIGLPLNMADLVILTKNQALMAYKIALACGLSADWRETIPKLAAVVGSGFIWRLIARQLVGLIPGFGIVPKVAVSFAGTYAVGQGIYQWCAHNEEVNPRLLRSAYQKALKDGREVARGLLAKRFAQQKLS